MTICIAVLCENGDSIIIASDRMVTVGSIIEFEHDVTKYEELQNNCIALTAGSATISNDVLKLAKDCIEQKKKPLFKEVVEELKKSFVTIRNRKAEEVHLKPLDLDYETFYKTQRALLPEIVFKLTESLSKSDLGVVFILCGFEGNKGHIHYIQDPGTSECFNSVGFCATGTGDVNAVSVFTLHKYAPSFPIEKALYLTFLAKKNAERAPGVGRETDIAILTDKGLKKLTSEQIKNLDRIYTEYTKVEEEEFTKVKNQVLK